MRIAIIGGGFTGLSAAYRLQKQGHQTTVFEKENAPGGLAIGYKEKKWDWTLEQHYHHWFTNTHDAINHDQTVLNLAKEIGHAVLIKRPKTSVYVDGDIFQFDSPMSVLRFPKLSLFQRIRMAATIGAIRYDPFWQPLEKVNASKFLPQAMGERAYNLIWKPQLTNKFGKYADDVSLAWFWARLASRTPALGYPEGGFLAFANHLVAEIEQLQGKVSLQTQVSEVRVDETITITSKNLTNDKTMKQTFDKVIVTLPSCLFLQMFPQLPETYKKKFMRLKSLGATNLVLRLKKPFFTDNTYWLSVCDPRSPIMAIVEHTNFMDKKHYNNEHLLYLGNYLTTDDKKYQMSADEQLALFDPFLRQLNPDYHQNIIGYELFKAPFAQPVIPTNYSHLIPSMITPLKNVFLANIDQVYPWDRGTSNAVAIGEKIAQLVTQ